MEQVKIEKELKMVEKQNKKKKKQEVSNQFSKC